jgi:hypothetical protein
MACGDLMELSQDKVVVITPPSTTVELEIAGDLRLMGALADFPDNQEGLAG